MRFPLVFLSTAIALFCWCSAGILHASPAIAITVTAPRPGTRLTSATGSATVFQPLADLRADGLKHPPPFLPDGAAPGKLHGVVKLSVGATKAGDVRKVTLDHSSGSPLLDETALAWVQSVWRYPALDQPKTYREQVRFETTNQDVSQEAKDVASARSIEPNTPRPPYPGPAIYKGWQGTVQLRLVPDGSGGVKEARVLATSHIPLLDVISKAWCKAYWRLSGNAATDCSITFQLR